MEVSLLDSFKITGAKFVFISAETQPLVVRLKLAISILLTPLTLLFLGRSIRVRGELNR
jgi:hypothetical protein